MGSTREGESEDIGVVRGQRRRGVEVLWIVTPRSYGTILYQMEGKEGDQGGDGKGKEGKILLFPSYNTNYPYTPHNGYIINGSRHGSL